MTIRKDRPVRPASFINQLRAAAAARPELKPDSGDLLVLSSSKDRFVSHKCSRRLAKALEAPIEIHHEAGHDLPEDAPEWTLETIIKHLN